MRSITVEGKKRDSLGKESAKSLRRQGFVPCVIYGTGRDNLHFYTEAKSFKDVLYTAEAILVVAKVDGEEYKCVVREAQFHPVSDDLEHVDLYWFREGVPITINVPIHLVGTPRGVRNGGRLKVNLRHLPVKAQLENMPGSLDLEIANLKIGDAFRIEDIKTEGFEIMREPTRTVLTIQTARNIVVTADEDDEEEGEEGEEVTAAEGEGGEEDSSSE